MRGVPCFLKTGIIAMKKFSPCLLKIQCLHFLRQKLSAVPRLPLGGRLRLKGGGEGQPIFDFLNIFNKNFLKIKGRTLFSHSRHRRQATSCFHKAPFKRKIALLLFQVYRYTELPLIRLKLRFIHLPPKGKAEITVIIRRFPSILLFRLRHKFFIAAAAVAHAPRHSGKRCRRNIRGGNHFRIRFTRF